jgi:hypothetical protein
MPVHGDYNEDIHKWYCSYWLTREEWGDIHDYAPSPFLEPVTDKNNDFERANKKEDADENRSD